MNGRAIGFVLAHLLFLLALCLLAPLVVTLILDRSRPTFPREILAFGFPLIGALVQGLLLRRLCRRERGEIRLREGFAVVTFSWLLFAAIGMLPYLISSVQASPADAFFETVSGFTTTGASIFPKVEGLPGGLMFWRCMTQWLGGMGVVVLTVALLPVLGVGGMRLLKAESPGGVVFERDRPRITDTAKELWVIYLALSLAETLLLRLSGMGWYDAVCHTFTTMSTGGFSTHTASIAFFGSPFTQWVLIAFMLLAAMNFSLFAGLVRGQVTAFFRNLELRSFLIIVAVCTAIGFWVVPSDAGVEQRLRTAAFQVTSIITTTGYTTADFDRWPELMRVLLVLIMFVGGCMGSTGGGIKVARVLVYAKAAMRELRLLVFPHAVHPVRLGERVLEGEVVANLLVFGSLFVALYLVGVLTMAACGYDPATTLSAPAAALCNVGPGLGKVGPTAHWDHLPDAAKWVMSALMLLGRLEIYSILVLATPWAWKR